MIFIFAFYLSSFSYSIFAHIAFSHSIFLAAEENNRHLLQKQIEDKRQKKEEDDMAIKEAEAREEARFAKEQEERRRSEEEEVRREREEKEVVKPPHTSLKSLSSAVMIGNRLGKVGAPSVPQLPIDLIDEPLVKSKPHSMKSIAQGIVNTVKMTNLLKPAMFEPSQEEIHEPSLIEAKKPSFKNLANGVLAAGRLNIKRSVDNYPQEGPIAPTLFDPIVERHDVALSARSQRESARYIQLEREKERAFEDADAARKELADLRRYIENKKIQEKERNIRTPTFRGTTNCNQEAMNDIDESLLAYKAKGDSRINIDEGLKKWRYSFSFFNFPYFLSTLLYSHKLAHIFTEQTILLSHPIPDFSFPLLFS